MRLTQEYAKAMGHRDFRDNTTNLRGRLKNHQGEFLHLSGIGTTSDEQYAWSGTKAQGKEVLVRAGMTGSWKFKRLAKVSK